MNCREIKETAPLWHSHELDGDRRAAFDAHVARCSRCAGDLHADRAMDTRIIDAIEAEARRDAPVVQEIRDRVSTQISRERFRRAIPLAAAAALVLAAGSFFAVRHREPVYPPQVTQTALSDAARDHTMEIIGRAQRRWRVNPVDIADIEKAQGISDRDVKAIEATGYRLEKAKICRLGGKPYMHLVYAKNGREVSLYMKVGADSTVDPVINASGKLHVATFGRRKVQTIIVSDAPEAECERFAQAAQAAL